MKPSRDLLGELGLSSEEDVHLCVVVPAPESNVAWGDAPRATEEDPSISGLAQWVRKVPHFSRVSELEELDLAGQVKRWMHDARIWSIEGVEAVHVWGPASEVEQGVWLVDTRTHRVWVAFEHRGRQLLLGGQSGELWVFAITSRLREVEGTRAAEADMPVVAAPVSDELLAGVALPAWLIDQARKLAGESLLERIEAAGTIGRFAAACSREPRDLLARITATNDGPVARVKRWADRALDAETRRRLVPRVLDKIRACENMLEELKQLVGVKTADAERLAQALCLHRDDLESIRFVLGKGFDSAVDEALEDFDRRMRMSLTLLDLCGDYDRDERLVAVRDLEPNAWWGAGVE